jgi:alkylated DNA repair protein alkB family protein 6
MVDAIDFKKLLREEKLKSRQNKAKETSDKHHSSGTGTTPLNETTPQHSTTRQLPTWPHPPGFLSMTTLSLTEICTNPATISYSSTAFQDAPQQALQEWLQRLPTGDSGLGEWKTMDFGKRRVCMFGEAPTTGASTTTHTAPAPLPTPLDELARELVVRDVFPAGTPPPNHVLLNEYQPGQGIMPHTDGPPYEQRTATLSLTSSVVMEFTRRRQDDAAHAMAGRANHDPPVLQVLLERGSLLVFTDDAYIHYCHGIAMDVWQDVTSRNRLLPAADDIRKQDDDGSKMIVVPRELRYSLTFRHKQWPSDEL